MLNNPEKWKRLLEEEASLFIDEDAIDSLLILDSIDPSKFIANYKTILNQWRPDVSEFFRVAEKKKTTPSLIYFRNGLRFAPVFPKWFYAAYPDVMVWFHEKQKNILRENNHDKNVLGKESAKLLGIDVTVHVIHKNDIRNQNGTYRLKYLHNLVLAYKFCTKNELEVATK